MANKDNQSKQYRIYIKESKSWVDVNKEFYTNYYRDINAYRKRLISYDNSAIGKYRILRVRYL